MVKGERFGVPRVGGSGRSTGCLMERPLVLLADDEAHITCVVAEQLRKAGFSVATARDGEEALELALRLHPTLVITDLQMPRMSGLDLALRLAASPSGAM